MKDSHSFHFNDFREREREREREVSKMKYLKGAPEQGGLRLRGERRN